VKVNRREFLHRVGAGSIALASLPALIDMFKLPALAQAERGFIFHAITAAGAAGPGQHTLVMGGTGRFDPSRGPGSPVTGGGLFFHFQTAASPPFPLVASGTWTARLLTSYREIGTYAGAAGGLGDFVVDIHRVRPSPALIRGAVLHLVCNVGPGGLSTGEIEGYTLSIPGTEFSAGGNPGLFRQIPPGGTGITLYMLPESLT